MEELFGEKWILFNIFLLHHPKKAGLQHIYHLFLHVVFFFSNLLISDNYKTKNLVQVYLW